MSARSKLVTKSRAGRPRASEEQIEENREQVLVAAERVYGALAYSSISVNHLLEEARISRPTFYRWFKNKDEVLDAIVARANSRMLENIGNSVKNSTTWADAIARGTDAYLQWGKNTGPLVAALFRDAQQTGSPVAKDRRRLSVGVVKIYQDTARRLNYPPIDTAVFLAIFAGLEQAGSHYFAKKSPAKEDLRITRAIMIRLALGTILYQSEDAPQLPLDSSG